MPQCLMQVQTVKRENSPQASRALLFEAGTDNVFRTLRLGSRYVTRLQRQPAGPMTSMTEHVHERVCKGTARGGASLRGLECTKRQSGLRNASQVASKNNEQRPLCYLGVS